MRAIQGRAAGALVLALGLSAAAAAAENRVPITDPDVLASMGFAREATNVYRLVPDGAPATDDFGSIDHFEIIHAKDFVATKTDQFAASYNGGGGSNTSISRSVVLSQDFYDAPVELPAGALIKDFTLYAIDNGATNINFFIFEVCVPEAGGAETSLVIATGSTLAAGAQAVTVPVTPNRTVNNATCAITARVNFMEGNNAQVVQKVRARWARQVSAAPATATFPNDVPTTHPFFRFIEAFARAGITGGCGAGSYCPAAPVTRGEMAVFISVALGLSFQ